MEAHADMEEKFFFIALFPFRFFSEQVKNKAVIIIASSFEDDVTPPVQRRMNR
jgi:hypothetical protein